MYSRSYNTSNRVPLNYNGTSIKVDESASKEEAVIPTTSQSDESVEIIENSQIDQSEEYLLANRPYARVPLMNKPKYSPPRPPVIPKRKEIDYGKPEHKLPDKFPPKLEKPIDKKPTLLNKINADDILLIGLLIVLLGCDNVDIKLIIAIAVLLFAGL